MEEEKALFHFHERPNPQCPVGKNIHAVLEPKLLVVQETMREQLALTTLQGLIDSLSALAQ